MKIIIRKEVYTLLLSLILFLCFTTGCEPVSTLEEPGFLVYTDNCIMFKYPDWTKSTADDEAVFLFRSNGESVFFASRYPVSSALLKQELVKNLDAIIEGEYCYYTFDTGEKKLDAVSRILYSDYHTYLITCAGPITAGKNLLASARVVKRVLNPKEGVGIMPIPANGDSSLIPEACRLSRELGADVISWYFFWGGLEDDWTVADCVMECLSLGGKSAAVMNIIHTNVLGAYPQEFKHFSDPGFREAFAEFSVEFVLRYKPEYYFIGGEVDIYLNDHRDEIPAFKEVFEYAYQQIKKARPETKVGSVFAYHYARDYGAIDIIQTLSEECDIVGYTVHPHEENFSYENVSRGLEALKEVKDVVPDRPYCIIETCWSSSSLLNSSEEKQAEFVNDFFDYVETGGAEFVIWFSLHDQDDCTEAARTHLEPVPDLQVDEAYVKVFEEFMCSPGLLYSDGTPKKALDIWKQYILK